MTTLYHQYWMPVREWFERILFCHHNARVLADMEYRFSCVLCEATGGKMSKAYYEKDVMLAVVRDFHEELYQDGYADGQADYGEPQ